MQIIDLHSDIFTDIAIRKARGESKVFERIHYPRLKKAGISTLICVFWVEPLYRGKELQRLEQIIDLVLDDLNDCNHVEIISDLEKLSNVNRNKISIFLGLEGLTFIDSWRGETMEEKVSYALHDLSEIHIQHAIFAWNEVNFLASGTGSSRFQQRNQPKGLTSLGKYAVEEMEKRKWIIDVSHLDEPSFWDVLHHSHLPIIASHSNAKQLCDVERNLTDEQMKAVAKTGGIIGVNAYGSFVDPHHPTRSRFIDHIIYIADLIGIEHVGFGFDFVDYLQEYNLGDTMSNLTCGLESVERVPELLDELVRRGFTNDDLEKICFTNAYELLMKTNSINISKSFSKS